MNYFEHHIGDYDADTAHLTWAEDMAYTRLLRLYYRREKPIPADVNEACRLVRAAAKDQKQAVADVLKEFFTLEEDGWHQRRADEELAKYMKKVEHNRTVGKLGGRPKKAETQKEPGGFPLGSQTEPGQNPLQSPDTSYSVAKATDGAGAPAPVVTKTKDPADMTKEELWTAGKSILLASGVPAAQCGSFVGKLVKDYTDTVVIEAVRAAVVAVPADAREYLKATCMRLKGERKDPVTVASDAPDKTAAYLAEQAEHARQAAPPPDLGALKVKLAIARAA